MADLPPRHGLVVPMPPLPPEADTMTATCGWLTLSPSSRHEPTTRKKLPLLHLASLRFERVPSPNYSGFQVAGSASWGPPTSLHIIERDPAAAVSSDAAAGASPPAALAAAHDAPPGLLRGGLRWLCGRFEDSRHGRVRDDAADGRTRQVFFFDPDDLRRTRRPSPTATPVTPALAHLGRASKMKKGLGSTALRRAPAAADSASYLTESFIKEFKTQVNTLASVQHPNLCKLIGFHAREECTERMLVYERLHHGSLDRLLFGILDGHFMDWYTHLKIGLGAAKGLNEGPFQGFEVKYIA